MADPIGVYVFRKSCLPFDYVSGIALVEEPVSVKDTYAGDGSYSLQFNVNCKNGGWPQMAFQFDKRAGLMELQFYESRKTVGFITSNDPTNPLPLLSGLDPDYVFTFEMEDDGKQLTGFASITYEPEDGQERIVWEMKEPFIFPTYDHPLIATLRPVGLGTPAVLVNNQLDVATFTSGKFQCIIEGGTDVDDLVYIAALPDTGEVQTPCGDVIESTDEASNLGYPVIEASGVSVATEPQLPIPSASA